MATQAGVVKSITGGSVIATDQVGNQRVLNVGDIVYLNDTVKTDNGSTVIIETNDGKDLTLLPNNTLSIDQSVAVNESFGAETTADITNLQQALLDGQTLADLEETAAGGEGAVGGGASLGGVSFLEGGHISNVTATYGNLENIASREINNDSAIGGSGADITPPNPPTVEFLEDTDNNGYINGKEFTSNLTKVKISVDSTASLGDTLTITIIKPDNTSEIRQVAIDQNIINNGLILNDVPIENGKNSIVRATITDQALNVSAPGSDQVTTDTTHPDKPTIEFIEDTTAVVNGKVVARAGGDQNLSVAENNSDSNPNETTARITLPNNAEVGDTVNVTITYFDRDGTTVLKEIKQDITISQNDKTNGYVDFTAIPVADGDIIRADATITDKALNKSAPADHDIVDVDLSNPPTPEVTFVKDTNNDGNLTNTENGGSTTTTTPVNITIPTGTKPGDTLNVTITKPDGTTEERSIPVTPTMITDGSITINDIPIQHDKTTKVEASIIDKAGNTGGKGSDTISTDITLPNKPTVVFTEDIGKTTDKSSGNDKWLSKDENSVDGDSNYTTVTIKVPQDGTVKPGDTLEYTIKGGGQSSDTKGSVIITQDIIDNGYPVPEKVPVKDGEKTEVVAEIIDTVGNKSGESSNHVQVDLTAPEVNIELNVIAGDDIISRAEANGKIKITGTADSQYAKSTDLVTIKVGDTLISDQVKITHKGGDIWEFSIETESSNFKEFQKDSSGNWVINNVKASITVSDTAGNTASDNTDRDVRKVTEQPPTPNVEFIGDTNNDQKLSKAENDKDKHDETENAKVTFDTDPDKIKTVEDMKAIIKQVGLQKGLTEAEAEAKANAEAESQADRLYIKVIHGDGKVTTETVAITNDMRTNGFTGKNLQDIGVANNKTSQVEVYIVNFAGNQGGSDIDKITTLIAPEVEFSEDKYTYDASGKAIEKAGGDGVLSVDENLGETSDLKHTTIKVKLNIPDAVAGDVVWLTYTDAKNPGSEITKQIVLTQADITNGHILYEAPIETDVVMNAHAVIKDSSGKIKSEESNKDTVKFGLTETSIKWDFEGSGKTYDKVTGTNEIKQVGTVITRLESVANDTIESNGTRKNNGDDDSDVNKTTAIVTLTNNVKDGDKLVITVSETTEPTNSSDTSTFQDRTTKVEDKVYTIKVDPANGAVSLDDGLGNTISAIDPKNPYSFRISDVKIYTDKHTSISAQIKDSSNNELYGTEGKASPEHAIRLESLKLPGVIFEEANGKVVISREEASSNGDGDLYHTTATVKLPDNTVDGDKLTIKITEPNLTTGALESRNIYYKVSRNGDTIKVTELDASDNEIGTPKDVTDFSFKIPNINTLTGVTTSVDVTITDKDSLDSSSGGNIMAISGIQEMSVKFDEDINANTILSRSEAAEDNTLQKTTASISLPRNLIEGDKLTIKVAEPGEPAEEYVYKVGKDANGADTFTPISATGTKTIEIANGVAKVKDVLVSFKLDVSGDKLNTEVSAEVVDKENLGKTEAKNSTSLTRFYDDMLVKFDGDVDNDGYRSSSEATDPSSKNTASITLPTNIVNGDKLIVKLEVAGESTPREWTYRINKDANGNATLTAETVGAPVANVTDASSLAKIVKIDLSDQPKDVKLTLTATVTDNDGEDKVEYTNDVYLLDGPGAGGGVVNMIRFVEDINRDGKINRVEAASGKDDRSSTAEVVVTIGSDAKDGDELEIKVNGIQHKVIRINQDGSQKISIGDVPMKGGTPTNVEATVVRNGSVIAVVQKTAELEALKEDISVSFKEDNLNRNNIIDRNEAATDGDMYKTTVSVTMPSNVTKGDKLTLTITEPGQAPRNVEFTIQKDFETRVVTVVGPDLENPGQTKTYDVVDNTFEFDGIAMAPGQKTKVEAKVADDQSFNSTKIASSESELAVLSAKDLTVTISEDINKDGIISAKEAVADQTASESNRNETSITLGISSNVTTGDVIKITYVDGNNATHYKTYTINKDLTTGTTTAKDEKGTPIQVNNNTIKIENIALPQEAALVDKDENPILDSLNKQVYQGTIKVTNAQIYNEKDPSNVITVVDTPIQAKLEKISKFISSVGPKEEVDGSGVVKYKLFLPKDILTTDVIKISYADPRDPNYFEYNADPEKYKESGKPEVAMMSETIEITQQNITDGYVYTGDILLDTSKDVSIKITTTIEDKDGDSSSKYLLFNENKHITIPDNANDTIEFSESKTYMYGGLGIDTLVLSADSADETINLSSVENLDSKVRSFEIIQLGEDGENGVVELSLNPEDVKAITDDPNTILKISGDEYDRFNVDNKWKLSESQDGADAGYKIYESSEPVNGSTVKIQVGDKVASTLVLTETVELGSVENLNAKFSKLKAIRLDGDDIELNINPKDVLDVTDSKDTILKILGDSNDKIKGQGWQESADQSKAEAGTKIYESVNQINGNTIQIQIDDNIQKDF